ncbi:glycosyltransferase family 4 protein [Alteromonas sp. CYL-A6]|uniref:glycosyltransferase family 4 protein n=1 Tax=Alteromonas nitratireducens TaxID=3390813 RepID=UPI0034B0DD62
MPRIMEIVQSLGKGGRTTRFADTVAGLRERGHTVFPVCFEPPAPWVNIDGISVIPRHSLKIATVWRLCRFIRAQNIELIHAHCECSQLYAGVAAKLCGIPMVSTFHRSDISKYQPSLSNSIIRWCSNACVAVSTERATLLDEKLKIPASQRFVVHGGTRVTTPPNPEKKQVAKQQLGLDEQQFHLLSVGHLGEIKGHKDTISALAALPDALRSRTMLHIAGSGTVEEEKSVQQHISALGMDNQVQLLGQITNVGRWLTACDLFVLPSHEEAFGLVFIEAGANELATVATRVGGIPDIIEHEKTGLLVLPGHAEQLAGALARLIEDEDLRRTMAKNAYQRVASQFSTDNMIERYLNIFHRIYSHS